MTLKSKLKLKYFKYVAILDGPTSTDPFLYASFLCKTMICLQVFPSVIIHKVYTFYLHTFFKKAKEIL